MEEKKLALSVEFSGGWQVVTLKGRLDANTCREAQDAILEYLTGITPKMVVEASGLEYLSSAGIRVLLMGAQKARNLKGGAFAIAKPTDMVRRILVDCGLDALLGVNNAFPGTPASDF